MTSARFSDFCQRCTADQQMAKSQSEVEEEVGIPELLSKTVLKGYSDNAGVLMIGRIVLRSGFYLQLGMKHIGQWFKKIHMEPSHS